jgi:DNA-binding HxlR family transcriptional regulator
MPETRLKVYNCPVDVALDVLGGKWTIQVLWFLSQGVQRFGQLRKSIPGITQKVLTRELRALEGHGIVRRKAYAQVPPRVDYSITAYGRTLDPLLDAMCEWGMAHARRRSLRVREPGDDASLTTANA